MTVVASPDNPFEVGDSVQYNSIGRPYLAGLPGKIVSFNTNKTSALVEFRREDGRELTEWIGISGIKRATNSNSAEEIIRQELRDVNEKYITVSAEYRKLSTRKSQLEAALRALNATYR